MKETTFQISELDCSSEEQLIRSALKDVQGIENLRFNFLSSTLSFTHEEGKQETVRSVISNLGMTVSEAGSEHSSCENCDSHNSTAEPFKWRDHIKVGVAVVLALIAEILSLVTDYRYSTAIIALVAIVLGGLPTLKKGYKALRAFSLNIHLLMTIAVIGAFLIGEFPEAALVITLFEIAEIIERYSLDKARNAIAKLLEATPDVAWVKSASGTWEQKLSAEIEKGTLIEIRPDEKIPLDGLLEEGTAVINQAPITGESTPIEKSKGDKVYAGSINGPWLIRVMTTGGKDETTIARIIRTVQEAQSERAPTQRFIDAFARYYTPIVVVLAILVALLGPLLTGQTMFTWLYQALVLLVISCPCALVISTPVTLVSGLASAARGGILIKGGAYLEIGRKISLLALDKTGTITEGKPKLIDIIPLNGVTKDSALQLAASLDATSNHPVAKAIVEGWAGDRLQLENISSITGRGVSAVKDGETYFIGNHRLAEERKVCGPEVDEKLKSLESQGKTVIILADSKKCWAIFTVADAPKDTSREAVVRLNQLSIQTVMLSGDNDLTAKAIAADVGISEARGGLLPEDKLEIINSYIIKRQVVGMVGDGVNDAPALAKSSVGFAMGAAGSDVAIETADVAIMNDDLRGVASFIELSKKTHSILVQNISLALVSKLLFFVLALLGKATLWMAVLADMGVSLLVVGNALRLLRWKRNY